MIKLSIMKILKMINEVIVSKCPFLEIRADEELVEMRTVLSIKEKRPGVEGILKKSFFSRLRMHDLHDLNYCLCWVLDKNWL